MESHNHVALHCIEGGVLLLEKVVNPEAEPE